MSRLSPLYVQYVRLRVATVLRLRTGLHMRQFHVGIPTTNNSIVPSCVTDTNRKNPSKY